MLITFPGQEKRLDGRLSLEQQGSILKLEGFGVADSGVYIVTVTDQAGVKTCAQCIVKEYASYFSSHHHQASVDNTLNSPCYFTTQPTSVLSPLCLSLTSLRQFSVATSKSHLSHTWSPSLFSVSCLGCAPPLSEWSSASFSTVEARSHTLTVTQCRYTFHFELRYVMEDKAIYSKETEVADRRQKGKDKRNVKKKKNVKKKIKGIGIDNSKWEATISHQGIARLTLSVDITIILFILSVQYMGGR
ncbi:unnamed protein product [Oncorhynchus mykiss]|uniref:Immunoglobulin V-set domain-containing protein n=1 Tax=Oncorhynchus mykiss TaxID=8022 RepID=A0A060W0H9_ONCMY|nr:unnamed protein product [Oncorhynchus mykiss]